MSDSEEEDILNSFNYYMMSFRNSMNFHTMDDIFPRELLEIAMAASPKKRKSSSVPDTSVMDNSDISKSIKLNAGLYGAKASSSSVKPLPLHQLLKMREFGLNGIRQFTVGNKCHINARYIPNKMHCVDCYRAKVFCGTFAKDGDLFISASQDFYLRLYNTSSGRYKLKKIVEGHDVGWAILDTAVSPDGRHFIYCSWSDCIHMCNVEGENFRHDALLLLPEEQNFCVFSNCFSHDGREILCGANDKCLYVYNLDENKRTIRISAHRDDVNSVTFADASSQIFFSAGDDGLCKVWDRRTLSTMHPLPVGVFVGHEDGLTYVDSKGDSRYLITNSKDQTIKLWDMRKFSPNSSIDECYKEVHSHNWDYRWQKVPLELLSSKIRLRGDTSLMTYSGHSVLQTLIRCHFSPEVTTGQQFIYTGCSNGNVVIYDVLTGEVKSKLNGHRSCVRDVSWHPYRNEIVTSSWDGCIEKWTYASKLDIDSDDEEEVDIQSGPILQAFRGPRSLITD